MPNTKTIVLVDGENVPKLYLAAFSGQFSDFHNKKFYSCNEGATKKAIKMGYHPVLVPHVGKESVDKAIAMDAVEAVFRGHNHIILVSNDRDFGDTAVHLRNKFPDIRITVAGDRDLIKHQVIKNPGQPLDSALASAIGRRKAP